MSFKLFLLTINGGNWLMALLVKAFERSTLKIVKNLVQQAF